TVALMTLGLMSLSLTARRWLPWSPTSARMTPLLSGITVSPEKTALSRPLIEGRLSKKDCAYASAARPTTSTSAKRPPRMRRIALRRSLWPMGDQFAWILALGLWPPLVLIVSGMSLDMVGGHVDSTFPAHTNGRGR